jgi:hypothetical protein
MARFKNSAARIRPRDLHKSPQLSAHQLYLFRIRFLPQNGAKWRDLPRFEDSFTFGLNPLFSVVYGALPTGFEPVTDGLENR